MRIYEIIGITPSPSSSGYFQDPYSHDPSPDKKKKSKKDNKKEKEPKYKAANKDRGNIIDIEV